MAVVKSIDVALRADTTSFESGMKRGVKSVDDFNNQTDRITKQMARLTSSLSTGQISAEEYAREIKKLDAALDRLNSGSKNVVATQQTMTKETSVLGKAMGTLGDSLVAKVAGGMIVAETAMKAFSFAAGLARRALDTVVGKFDEIDSAKTAAAAIGVTTGELMILRKALEEVGNVAAPMVDASLGRMIRNLATAAETGKGTATVLRDKLGLSLERLAAMPTKDAFLTIADAIGKLDTAGQQAAVAVAVFGKQGAALLPVMQGNNAEIKESIEFFKRFGFEVSELDATTIDNAGDKLKRLSAALEGVATQIAVKLGPQIEAVANAFLKMADKVQPAIAGIGAAVERLGEITALTADVIAGLALGPLKGSMSITAEFRKEVAAVKAELAKLGPSTTLLSPGVPDRATGPTRRTPQTPRVTPVMSDVDRFSMSVKQDIMRQNQLAAAMRARLGGGVAGPMMPGGKTQEQLLAEQRKANAHLAKISRGGVVLAAAAL